MNKAAAFTSRDFNRQPAKVFDAARKFGKVKVRLRSGEVFTLSRDKEEKKKVSAEDIRARFEAMWKKQRELGAVPPPASENERINRIIAGEE